MTTEVKKTEDKPRKKLTLAERLAAMKNGTFKDAYAAHKAEGEAFEAEVERRKKEVESL